MAYSEILGDECKETASAFFERAWAFSAAHGITIARMLTDNGSCYRSALFTEALGPDVKRKRTRPYRPQTKPTVERFFRTLRESLLQHLPAYKGPDVYSRGKDVEDKAFYYVSELEQIIREWVGSVYHRTQHDGLCVPEMPRAEFCPAEMFEIGVAKSGGLLLPGSPDLAYEFLDVRVRKQ